MSEWQEAEHHVERASELIDMGRWEEAEAELRKALAINSQQPEWHFNLGLTLDAAGRTAESVGCFRAAAELDPKNVNARLCLAVALQRTEDFAGALASLEEVRKIDPNFEPAYCHQIGVLASLNRHDEAEQTFYEARLLKEECPLCYANLGESFLARRSFERAIWCFREAQRLDPRLNGLHARLALAFASKGDREQAYRLYLRDLRDDPGNVQTLLEIGDLLISMERTGEAAEKFRRVLELEPANAAAHLGLGRLARCAGRLDVARVELDLAQKLNAETSGLTRELASLWIDEGNQEAARAALASLMDEFAEDGDQRLEGVRLLVRVGMLQEAATLMVRHLKTQPYNADGWHQLSVIRLTQGRLAQGIRAARTCLRYDPCHSKAHYNLILAYRDAGRLGRAAAAARAARKALPRDAGIRRLTASLGIDLFIERVTLRLISRRRPRRASSPR